MGREGREGRGREAFCAWRCAHNVAGVARGHATYQATSAYINVNVAARQISSSRRKKEEKKEGVWYGMKNEKQHQRK